MLLRGALRLLLVVPACCSKATEGTGCSTEDWTDAFQSDRCYIDGDAMVVSCSERLNSGSCGMRSWAPGRKLGAGAFSATIRAAPGDGVVTSFYLSNNGGMYDEGGGQWNEVDFEILGKQAGKNSSRVWTNLFTGSAEEHAEWVTLPFDTARGFHTYTFNISAESIKWLVDGVVYRTQDIADFPDVKYSVESSTFEAFMSLWGKTSSDGFTACDEFIKGMGKMDDNNNTFPINASFKTEFNPPVPRAKGKSSTSRAKDASTATGKAAVTTTAASAGPQGQKEESEEEGESAQTTDAAQSTTSRGVSPVACGPVEADVTFVVMPPAWYHAVDDVPAIEGCCARCQREEKCRSYTYVKAGLVPGNPSQCWMFGDAPAERAPKPGATSGFPPDPAAQPPAEAEVPAPEPKPKPEPAPTTTGQLPTSVGAPAPDSDEKAEVSMPPSTTTLGADITPDCAAMEDAGGTVKKSSWHTRAPDVSSREVCCSWCKAEPRCKSWTWLQVDPVEGASQCYLKGAAAKHARVQALYSERRREADGATPAQETGRACHWGAAAAAACAACAAAALLAAAAARRRRHDGEETARPELAPLRAAQDASSA